ncbi:MAG: Gfo/Idh/MocA family oxidoreductase, partial [Selenomonadaceae bacterium]|nr:Gfo/Idh/MocA family oxidoreductase [Selenomonadaceae bacterium]
MKSLVVGYGSMGRRRIRLLKKIMSDVEIIAVDANPDRLAQARSANLTVYSNLDDAIAERPDFAFVSTSPAAHADIALSLAKAGINFFTELNLIDKNYDEIIAAAKSNGSVAFMSSSMLYDKRVHKIADALASTPPPYAYIFHVGQYLPDWHPWESYKDFFVSKKLTNAIREIYAVQLPWLMELFGKITEINAIGQKLTKLELDFPDTAISTFKHENGTIGVFTCDVASRAASTSLEVINENIHLFWYGHNDDLFLYDIEHKKMTQLKAYETVEHIEGYADNIIEDRYVDEIKNFLDVIYKGVEPKYTFEK